MEAGSELRISKRTFTGKRPETPEAIASLTPEVQAGLRQYSFERMLGYGVDYADVVELRARVLQGEPWQQAAVTMAGDKVAQAVSQPPLSSASQSTLYYRASALLRISQALMLNDSAERVDIVARAIECYERSSKLRGDRHHVRIETPDGPMAGWFFPATDGPAVGSVISIGGIEGWAMDFDCIGEAHARRGVNALMLDAPGQGETRILHRHYLTSDWLESFGRAIDFVQAQLPDRPVGIVGNSMGGSVALAVANNDRRIAACVNNGGAIQPSLGRAAGATFFAKMVAFCGIDDEALAVGIWDTVMPVRPGVNTEYALLAVQGGADPMITVEHAQLVLARAPVADKRMELFSDGDHCIYNHRSDRDILISEWMRSQLQGHKTSA